MSGISHRDLDSIKAPFSVACCLFLKDKIMGRGPSYYDSNATIIGKKIGVGLALILLIPISLIEGIIRGIFAVPALLGLLLPEGNEREWYKCHLFEPLVEGSLMTLSMFASIAKLTYFNMSNKRLSHEQADSAFSHILPYPDGIMPRAPRYTCC